MHPDSEGRRWLKQVLPTLPVDPSLYPQQIDLEQNLALMIQMAEEDYERAAFLDERVISPSTRGSWLPLRGLLEMRGRIRRHLPPAWLFHIGHCGSTLISRLLGAHPHLLALREPATLQMLAYARRAADQETGPELLELCLALLSRSFRKTQRAFIKPTSDCSNLIEPLLGTDREAPAILLYVSLETYAATMLRAAALRADIENRHPARSRDLESRLGKPAQACTDDAQRVAVSWLSSMSAFAQAANACANRVMWLDFDDFLVSPQQYLGEAAAFLGAPLAADDAATLVTGPLMQRYSKNPAKGYTAAIRQEQLRDSRDRCGDEIAAAIDFAENLGKRFAAIATLHEHFRRPD